MVQSNTVSIIPATHADRHSVGGEDPLTGYGHIGAVDLCSGIMPTIAGNFTTHANALGNITDGDPTTYTGIGTVDTIVEKEDIVSIDLGAITNIFMLHCKFDYRGEQGFEYFGKIDCNIETSSDGIIWYNNLSLRSTTDNIWEYYNGNIFVNDAIRYIRFRATTLLWSGYLRIREYRIAEIKAYGM